MLLATTVQRERLVASPNLLSAEQRRATVGRARRACSSSTRRPRSSCARSWRPSSRYLILRHGLDRTMADRIRAGLSNGRLYALSLEPEPERVYPQGGGGKDTTLAAQLLGFVNRDGVGQYGVEQHYQDTLAGSPRIVVADRDASGRPVLERATVTQPGRPGHGPATDDRCRAPGPGRAGAARGLDRRQGQAGVGGRARPVHRRGLRRGDVPVVRRQRVPGRSPTSDAVAVHRSGGRQRLRAGLGVQDDDGRGRARARDGHAVDPDQGRRDAPARRRPDARSTTPTARAWAR